MFTATIRRKRTTILSGSWDKIIKQVLILRDYYIVFKTRTFYIIFVTYTAKSYVIWQHYDVTLLNLTLKRSKNNISHFFVYILVFVIVVCVEHNSLC